MTRMRFVVVLVAGALVAGCSLVGSSDPDEVTGSAAPAGEVATSGPTGTPTGAGTPTGDRTGTGGPAGSPQPTAARPVAVPDSVMLRGPDWAGGTVRKSTTGVAGLPQTEPSACQARTAYPSDRGRLAARTVSIASDAPESGGLFQVVVRYASGRGAQAMAEMRRVLAACDGYAPAAGVSPPAVRSYRLEAERFAGDDALLVRRADRQPGLDREWATAITVVRVGDALITTSSELGEGTTDPVLARRLAVLGAARAACLRTTC